MVRWDMWFSSRNVWGTNDCSEKKTAFTTTGVARILQRRRTLTVPHRPASGRLKLACAPSTGLECFRERHRRLQGQAGVIFRVTNDDGHLKVETLDEEGWKAAPIGMLGLRAWRPRPSASPPDRSSVCPSSADRRSRSNVGFLGRLRQSPPGRTSWRRPPRWSGTRPRSKPRSEGRSGSRAPRRRCPP